MLDKEVTTRQKPGAGFASPSSFESLAKVRSLQQRLAEVRAQRQELRRLGWTSHPEDLADALAIVPGTRDLQTVVQHESKYHSGTFGFLKAVKQPSNPHRPAETNLSGTRTSQPKTYSPNPRPPQTRKPIGPLSTSNSRPLEHRLQASLPRLAVL